MRVRFRSVKESWDVIYESHEARLLGLLALRILKNAEGDHLQAATKALWTNAMWSLREWSKSGNSIQPQ